MVHAYANRQLISSEDVRGTEVYGLDNKVLGQILYFIIDKTTGRIAYAVISFGGFWQLVHNHYHIPWSALEYDEALQAYRTGITEAQLKNAPTLADDSLADREWEARTHQHYGAPRYWMGG